MSSEKYNDKRQDMNKNDHIRAPSSTHPACASGMPGDVRGSVQ